MSDERYLLRVLAQPPNQAAAAKEHDRCGSNLVGPYLLATIATNLLARGRKGVKSPAASAAAGAAGLDLALEELLRLEGIGG